TVIATAGSAEKLAVCKELGADIVINYREEDFVPKVKEATGGKGADVIFDPVGGDTFDRSRKCIAFEGRILVIGFAGGRIADAPTNHALIKNYSIVGVHFGLF
ncbi:zinc-binding dehydrogenase, partial [Streptococcus pneumoniae]|nr:zinc-binding dehydrogenase [Streptococcus pneumoniae]